MATVTGILCDVSGSMHLNAGGQFGMEGGTWARSMFNVIEDLIKNDVSPNNRVFTIGIGAICGNEIFDILATIEQFKDCENTAQSLTHHAVVQNLFDLLQSGGARNIRKWATIDLVVRSVSFEFASLCLNLCRSNTTFLRTFVNKCLPQICRDWGDQGWIFNGLTQDMYSSCVSSYVQAKESNIEDVVLKAKNILLKNVGTVFTVQEASQIVHGCLGKTKLTDDRINYLMKIVEPFIYGSTPMYRSLDQARRLFFKTYSTDATQMLFILSDGEPTDYPKFTEISDVTIVSCFINRTTDIEAKRLYSKVNMSWSPGAKFLFDISSQIPTERLPRSLFVRRGWTIDISNNRTKLFMQVNDPKNIHDACDLAKNIVCCQDALSDILASVSLDMHINQNNSLLKASEKPQEGDTCYANASASVVHLAMKRVLGRRGGYPKFDKLRQDIIDKHGIQSTSTLSVLREICPIYRLRCTGNIGTEKARKAISEKRPVVAIFALTENEWVQFRDFYEENPKGILSKTCVDISKRVSGCKLVGHAVVLTSYNSEWLHLMNSWGDLWADMGFFRIQNAEVLDLKFIDVFWTLEDLLIEEKAYFRNRGGEVADNLIKKFIGLQKAEYQCPQCLCVSLVIDFKGTLREAICPKCTEKFKCNESGNILAMNIYLTAIATKF